MAVVRKMKKIGLTNVSPHTEVESTYSIVALDGEKFLQIDTYGSKNRQETGKKSQSIRFSVSAIRQIKEIIHNEL